MLTSEERREVLLSPAVRDATEHRIMLRPEFRVHLLACMRRGESPTKVFEQVGLPSSLIGCKRIERAAAHVRESRRIRDLLDREGDVWEDRADVWGRYAGGGDAVVIALSMRVNSLERQMQSLRRELLVLVSTGGYAGDSRVGRRP